MTATFEYDLFIIHAEADEPFVLGHLLPASGLAPERVMLSSALPLGAIKMTELERGVRSSRFTLAVLSPAFTTDRLAELAELLASHASGAEGHLVPLLLADCEVPARLAFRVSLDFRDPSRWAGEGQKLRAHLQQPAAAAADIPCPYPGTQPYSADTATHFCGRDAEIEALLGRLRAGERELYVIGPPGSGKSSLVAAGVVPRLVRGEPGLGPVVARSMRPGERPATQLGEILEAPGGDPATFASAVDALLARHAPGTCVLIVVDPLEELFTRASADERARFLAALRALRAEPRCILVFTLRADFCRACRKSPLWKELRGRPSRIEVGPLGDEALRAAIERPARDLGVYFEPALVERLLADAAPAPRSLARLQETLVQLWSRRRLRMLTLSDYEALGGGRDGSGVAVARPLRVDGTLRRRLLFVAAAMPLLLALTSSLAFSTGARRATCSVPGLRAVCAATGIGVAPTPAEAAPRHEPPPRDSEDRRPDSPDMVIFTGAKIREGIFDASQRPATCAALPPTEDCARAQDPREVPELALDDFYLDRLEVTNRELAAWLDANPGAWRLDRTDPTVIETAKEPIVDLVRVSNACGLAFVHGHVRPGPARASQPVTCVTWMAARDYCRAQGKRLPSRLEWELAAKGAEGRAFPWGRSMPRHDGVAFARGGSTDPHPVDVGTSNQDITPQGVRDLGGNVAEWVADDRGGSSETATIRGGSWHSSDPCRLLSSGCKRIKVTRLSTDVGFRCARSVSQSKAGHRS